jgi:hypothetical protein
MRKQFVENQNLRIKFIGTFIRFGMRNNFKGMPMETLLFKDIRSIDESIYEDHVWFNMTKEFNKIETQLKEGVIVEFDTRIKGYVNRRELIDNREIDYKLSYPTKIRIISNELQTT